jgi:hypothetical protein
MIVAHALLFVNWPDVLKVGTPLAALAAVIIFSVLKERRDRRKEQAESAAAKKNIAPYLERFQAQLNEARIDNTMVFPPKAPPPMQEGDDPETFKRAWAEFLRQNRERDPGIDRWKK